MKQIVIVLNNNMYLGTCTLIQKKYYLCILLLLCRAACDKLYRASHDIF